MPLVPFSRERHSYTAAAPPRMPERMPDPDELLRAATTGNGAQLFDALAAELRSIAGRIARSEAGHTMHPTALVNELCVQFYGARPRTWKDQQHFVRWAATAMRYILIDYKRQKATQKRGGSVVTEPLDDVLDHLEARCGGDITGVHEALNELAQHDPDLVDYVSLRFFGGHSNATACRVLGITERQGERQWMFARIWLQRRLRP